MNNQFVALVSCVKSKLSSAAPAHELYTSQLFSGMSRYAQRNAAKWFILSAEHGLLRPEQIITPYEKTLNKMSKTDRVNWAKRVNDALLTELAPGAVVLILAGERYREGVVPFLKEHGFKVLIPMAGMKFGQQLRWLNSQVPVHE